MIGSYLRQMRKSLGLSQEDLARILNVSYATVNRWEQNKNRPSRLAMQSIDAFCTENHLRLASQWLAEGGVLDEG